MHKKAEFYSFPNFLRFSSTYLLMYKYVDTLKKSFSHGVKKIITEETVKQTIKETL